MKISALFKKEIRIAFSSAMAYVVFTVFIFIIGKMFFDVALNVARNAFAFGQSGSIAEILFRPLSHNTAVILLFMVPALTMRLFAEERRSGTIELLFTYPFRDEELLAGKFLAALVLLLFLLLPTLLFPFSLMRYTVIEWPVIGMQFFGLLLLGGAYLAVGIWASQMTDNQIVAATLALGTLLFFWIIGWISQTSPDAGWSVVLSQLSITNHFDSFSKGVLNTQDLTYYLFFTGFFLYLALKGLESRGWRGARE